MKNSITQKKQIIEVAGVNSQGDASSVRYAVLSRRTERILDKIIIRRMRENANLEEEKINEIEQQLKQEDHLVFGD